MKLKLYRPLKGDLTVTQSFMENATCIKADGTGGVVGRSGPVCPTGYVSIYKYFGMDGHNALDLAAKDWQPVFASLAGVVTELSTERERGLGIGIISEQKYEWDDGYSSAKGENQIKTRYWHLAGMNVKMGDKVKVGDVIGWADNTGYSTGTHLHFEVKPVENGVNVLQNNGMFGCIDPIAYLGPLSAYEKTDLLTKIQLFLWDIGDQVKYLKK